MNVPDPHPKFQVKVRRELEEARRRACETLGVPYKKRHIRIPGHCSGCGGSLDGKTPGCHNCRCRHEMRVKERTHPRQRKGTGSGSRTGRCAGCQGPLDAVNPACKRCRTRRHVRAYRARKTEALCRS